MLNQSQNQENHLQFIQTENKKLFSLAVLNAIKPIALKINSISIRKYLMWSNQMEYNNSTYSYTKCKKICILTGRSRSVYRFFRVSRLKLREYGQSGYFIGLKKASW